MPNKVRAFLGLGSNIGDSRNWLRQAVEELPGVIAVSPLYRTEPVGGPDQDDYLNIVVAIETELSSRDLLLQCQRIELEAGRERLVKNGPRTLDIDILLYDNRQISEPGLEVPHPRMFQRNFVISPLLDIAPELAFDEAFTSRINPDELIGDVEEIGEL